MSSSSRSTAFQKQLSEVIRALANEHRLAMIDQLSLRPHSVEALAELTSMSLANTSQHLQTLKKAGLVLGERDGKSIVYQLGDGPILAALEALRALAEHRLQATQCAIDDYMENRDFLQAIGPQEVLSLMRSDSIVLLDVRPAQEYRAGHLRNARNVTLDELESRMRDIPKGKEIIAYCRGPTCILSVRAAQKLRERGYKVRRLSEGFPEWIKAGLAVENEL